MLNRSEFFTSYFLSLIIAYVYIVRLGHLAIGNDERDYFWENKILKSLSGKVEYRKIRRISIFSNFIYWFLKIGLRMKFFCCQGIFFMNFDFINECKNEF